jgi:hypothetical protein
LSLEQKRPEDEALRLCLRLLDAAESSSLLQVLPLRWCSNLLAREPPLQPQSAVKSQPKSPHLAAQTVAITA